MFHQLKIFFNADGLIGYVTYLRTYGCYSLIQTCAIAALVSPDLVRLDTGAQIWQKFCCHFFHSACGNCEISDCEIFNVPLHWSVNFLIFPLLFILALNVLHFDSKTVLFLLLYWSSVKNHWMEPDSLQMLLGQICSFFCLLMLMLASTQENNDH